MHVAVIKLKSLSLVVWLLDEKVADVNAITADGRTALHWADTLDILNALLDRGAATTVADCDGRVPLMLQTSSSKVRESRGGGRSTLLFSCAHGSLPFPLPTPPRPRPPQSRSNQGREPVEALGGVADCAVCRNCQGKAYLPKKKDALLLSWKANGSLVGAETGDGLLDTGAAAGLEAGIRGPPQRRLLQACPPGANDVQGPG